VAPQEAPDILLMDIDQFACQQRRRPIGITGRRRLIQQGKNAFAMLGAVFRFSAAITGFAQSGHPMAGKAHPPF